MLWKDLDAANLLEFCFNLDTPSGRKPGQAVCSMKQAWQQLSQYLQCLLSEYSLPEAHSDCFFKGGSSSCRQKHNFFTESH